MSAYATGRRCPDPGSAPGWLRRATAAGVEHVVIRSLKQAAYATPSLSPVQQFRPATIHLRTMADVRHIARTLDGTGVRWAVLKGPLLAQTVYQTPLLRTYSDLDVLVHPFDMEAALDLLEESGAVLLDRNWRMINSKKQGEITLMLPHGTPLDLHWHVVNRAASRGELRVTPQALFAQASSYSVDDVDVPGLSPVDTLLYVALHASLSGGHSIRWMLDIQQTALWARPSPAELAARADQLGLSLIAACMIERAGRLLDLRLLECAQHLAPRSPWRHLSGATAWLWPPGAHLEGRYSGQMISRSTRTSTASSGRRLLLDIPRFSGHKTVSDNAAELRLLRTDDGGAQQRAAWLRTASAAGQAQH